MKHYEKRRSVSSKLFVMMLALVLVFGCAVGGTIAWLTAETTPVVNTFTYGDINITLAETVGPNFKIVPGVNVKKDPKVTVEKDSEDCWLFVKVDEENWPTITEEGTTTRKVSYGIADGWTPLTGVTGVYYREVDSATTDTVYSVLKDDQVTVSDTLTKLEIASLKDEDGNLPQPKLTFTAYAVQKDGIDDAATAWDKVKPTTSTT